MGCYCCFFYAFLCILLDRFRPHCGRLHVPKLGITVLLPSLLFCNVVSTLPHQEGEWLSLPLNLGCPWLFSQQMWGSGVLGLPNPGSRSPLVSASLLPHAHPWELTAKNMVRPGASARLGAEWPAGRQTAFPAIPWEWAQSLSCHLPATA